MEIVNCNKPAENKHRLKNNSVKEIILFQLYFGNLFANRCELPENLQNPWLISLTFII